MRFATEQAFRRCCVKAELTFVSPSPGKGITIPSNRIGILQIHCQDTLILGIKLRVEQIHNEIGQNEQSAINQQTAVTLSGHFNPWIKVGVEQIHNEIGQNEQSAINQQTT